MSEVTDLLARIEAATKGSRELPLAILAALLRSIEGGERG